MSVKDENARLETERERTPEQRFVDWTRSAFEAMGGGSAATGILLMYVGTLVLFAVVGLAFLVFG